jgi:hypothetical protein
MPKKKKFIFIGEEQYPIDGLSLEIPASLLVQWLKEEREKAQRTCISSLRPFVSGHVGRTRLQEIELAFDEEVVMVEETAEPEVLFIDDGVRKVVSVPDYRNIIQLIERSK